MEIIKNRVDNNLDLALIGRLDTTTAPELETVVKENVEGVTALTLDFAKLEYISSAGLRILLATQKTMNKQGTMVIHNVNADIMEVFEITGFSDILTVE